MTPKASFSELVAVRTLEEQSWAYARRLEHLSYAQMRTLANRSPKKGGLGYDLSESALKGLVKGYIEHARPVLETDRDEEMARELHDLDIAQQALGAQIAADAAMGARLDVQLVREYRAVGAERRKLLGLDAPVVAKLDITTHDAVTDELNAMLARAGHKPIEVPHD